MKAESGPSMGGVRSGISSGRIGSVGTLSRGPSAEGRSGFSSRTLSIPSSRIFNPGLKVNSYINPNVRRNEAFAPFGLPKSPEKGFKPTSITSIGHVEKNISSTHGHKSKRTEAFLPFYHAANIYSRVNTERSHRRRPGRSIHQEIPNIKHNSNYEIKKPERSIAPVVERRPIPIDKPQPELFTTYYTLLKKEKVKSQVVELPRLPRDKIDLGSPQLRSKTLRKIKTITDQRIPLKPGSNPETSITLKTRTDLLDSIELQDNVDLSTVTELMVSVAKSAQHNKLKDEEDKLIEEKVLYKMEKVHDLPKEEKDDEPARLDQDAQANAARKEIIIKAIKMATIKAKSKDEALTGKDVNLPKKPNDDVLSELAKELGLEHDGSWSALVYAMQAVGKIDQRIDKFIQSAIGTFTAVRRRKRPAKPATKENAQLVVTGGISIDEDKFKSRLAA